MSLPFEFLKIFFNHVSCLVSEQKHGHLTNVKSEVSKYVFLTGIALSAVAKVCF